MAISGFIVARHAKLKGRNSIGWFIYGALVPVISLVHVGLIKPLDQLYYHKTNLNNGRVQWGYENEKMDQEEDINDRESYFQENHIYSDDFKKVQSEYLKAEKLKRAAELDREKASLARQEAEEIRRKAFRMGKNKNRIECF